MGMFRKKPVVIEAFQFGGANYGKFFEWCPVAKHHLDLKTYLPYLTIDTREGVMRADIDDWIIKGVKGEFYPCKPDIFDATYEAVN